MPGGLHGSNSIASVSFGGWSDAKAEALAYLSCRLETATHLDGEAGAEALAVGYAPGHVGGVVGQAELAVCG
jgi:hypothetical protein